MKLLYRIFVGICLIFSDKMLHGSFAFVVDAQKEEMQHEELAGKKLNELDFVELVGFFENCKGVRLFGRLCQSNKAASSAISEELLVKFDALLQLMRSMRMQDFFSVVEQERDIVRVEQKILVYGSDYVRLKTKSAQRNDKLVRTDDAIPFTDLLDDRLVWDPLARGNGIFEIELSDLLKLKMQELLECDFVLMRCVGTPSTNKTAEAIRNSVSSIDECVSLLLLRLTQFFNRFGDAKVKNLVSLCRNLKVIENIKATKAADYVVAGKENQYSEMAPNELNAVFDDKLIELKKVLIHFSRYRNCLKDCFFSDQGFTLKYAHVIGLPDELTIAAFNMLEPLESFKKMVVLTCDKIFKIDKRLYAQFMQELQEYVTELSKGKKWELAVICFMFSYGEALGVGKLVDINKHIMRPGREMSREFDLVLERNGSLVLCECKNIDWNLILDPKDSRAYIRCTELKQQLLDQLLIARAKKCDLFVLSKHDLPIDIAHIEDPSLRQVLSAVTFISPNNAKMLADLYKSKKYNFKD